jgi:hypothetical protein
MIETSVRPSQFEKHTPPKHVYQKYETYNTNTMPLKLNSLKNQMGHNLP